MHVTTKTSYDLCKKSLFDVLFCIISTTISIWETCPLLTYHASQWTRCKAPVIKKPSTNLRQIALRKSETHNLSLHKNTVHTLARRAGLHAGADWGWLRWVVGVGVGVGADNLKCNAYDVDTLLTAAQYTVSYVKVVGQEASPSKCVLLSTS